MKIMKKICFNLIGYRRDYFEKDIFGKGKIWVVYFYIPYVSKIINRLLKRYYFKEFEIGALKYNDDYKYICYVRRWMMKDKRKND